MASKIGTSLYTGGSVAQNVKSQVIKSIPQALGKQLIDQFIEPLPSDAIEQIFGKKTKKTKEQKPSNFELADFQAGYSISKTKETLIFSAEEEQKRQRIIAKEMATKAQVENILAQLANEKAIYKAQVEQLQQTIETVAESAGVNLSLSIEQTGNVGVYHIRLLEKLLKFIRSKADKAKEWNTGLVVRAEGKRARGLQVFWQKGASKQQVTEQGTLMLQG